MKNQQLALLLLAPLSVAQVEAQSLDWNDVERILPGTFIIVETIMFKETLCTLEKVTDQQLLCRSKSTDPRHPKPPVDRTFDRKEISEVRSGDTVKAELSDNEDDSKGLLAFLSAFGGGTALDPAHQPSLFGGVKGGVFGTSLDLQYDLLRGHSGFSVEGSGVLPLFRAPAYYPLRDKKFLKVYAEPGMGYRAGAGRIGEYASAKVLLILLDDHWYDKASPHIEIQRRFPLGAPLDGDTRLAFGLMWAYCWHCGVE
jgi:hypothetical protein